jgi:hypothetical protein
MAATPIVANGDTSLILVNSRNLTANQAAVVLLSSINTPGRVVTVRDSVGFLSSPQRVIVSTLPGVSFSDGLSSITFNQPFGYLTVTSRDESSWNLTNTFGFPDSLTVANVLSVDASTITAGEVYIASTLSTNSVTARALRFTSTAAVLGPTYISSLIVGSFTPPYLPFTTDPGYNTYIQGNARILSNLEVGGAGQFRGLISTGSNLVVAGRISTTGSFGARGDIQTLGSIYALSGGLFTNNLDVRGNATILGAATFSNSVAVGSTVTAGTSISTLAATTSSLSVFSQISMQGKTISVRPNDLLFSHGITVPSISTNFLAASNGIQTQNLTVTNSIIAEATQFLTLSSATIINPAGSLLISSITANNATVSNDVSTQRFQASSVFASSILLRGSIDAAGSGYITMNTAFFSSISTSVLVASAVQARAFSTTALSVESVTLTSSLIANSLSTCSLSNVSIVNTGGSISTTSLTTRNFIATSSIQMTGGIIASSAPTLRLIASNVTMDRAAISTVTASTMTISSMTATRLTMGAAPPAAGLNGPIFRATNFYPSTNVAISGGPGDYLTPFFISSVKPPGIGPGDPYTVEASFYLDFNGPTFPGYYASIIGLNLFPNEELNSQISIRTYNDSNTLVTLYGLFGTNQSYSTPPGTGGIPVPPGPLPSSFIHIVGTMYGNSAFTLQFQSRFNDNFTSIDSNTVITMNNGVLRWPYFLNGTTIQNSLNDMSVRNIYYYGTLSFASDPALKEQVAAADLDRCTDIIEQIPIKRFKYKDAYLSTFQVRDTHRLGILATDLEEIFPKSIQYTELDGFGHVRLVDTQQLEMAHIGATQALLARISTLTRTVEELI